MVRVGIIGAGASGLYCAILLAKALKGNACIELIEQNSAIAKRLLASGNGRCNLSHTPMSVEGFFNASKSEIERLLGRFSTQKLQEFFAELGILLHAESDGRIFPYANDAKSVVCVLQETCDRLGIKIFLEHEVFEVSHKAKSYHLAIRTKGQTEGIVHKHYEYLVFATGSVAYPKLGDGKQALGILQGLGHTLSPLYPALVPLNSAMIPKSFAGVRQRARIHAKSHKRQISPFIEGDLLFCDYGISGTSVLDLSPYISQELLKGQEVAVIADILPSLQTKECLNAWARALQHDSKASLLRVLCGCLPKKLALGFLKMLELEKDATADMKTLKMILSCLKAWRIPITHTRGFEYAEVAGGGVALQNCKLDTLESKHCPRLFVIGEALEITGHRGGYNLYFALCSAFIASSCIAARIS